MAPKYCGVRVPPCTRTSRAGFFLKAENGGTTGLSDSVLCRHTVVPTFKVDDFCTRTGDYSIYVFHSSRISGPFSSTKTETC